MTVIEKLILISLFFLTPSQLPERTIDGARADINIQNRGLFGELIAFDLGWLDQRHMQPGSSASPSPRIATTTHGESGRNKRS